MGTALDAHFPVTVSHEDCQFCIRPITPDDRGRILKGLEALSVETTYRRFFTPTFYPNEQELQYLTEVDGQRHVAIGVVDCTREGRPGVGAARYVRLPESPSVAEAAIVVIDAYQRQGIGSLLLAALSRYAAAHGVEQFRGYILAENTPVLRFLRALGATTERTRAGVVQVDVPVYAAADELPVEPQLPRARWAWNLVAAAPRAPCDEPPSR